MYHPQSSADQEQLEDILRWEYEAEMARRADQYKEMAEEREDDRD